jgi:hypothetical protein
VRERVVHDGEPGGGNGANADDGMLGAKAIQS